MLSVEILVLILSIQRPDRKVLDDMLKNNLTVKIGFKCADIINSRIISTPGSEKLKGKGRMLITLPMFSKLKEIQAPYLALDKAKKILETYKTAKLNNRFKSPKQSSSDVIDLQESENGIFEVLD